MEKLNWGLTMVLIGVIVLVLCVSGVFAGPQKLSGKSVIDITGRVPDGAAPAAPLASHNLVNILNSSGNSVDADSNGIIDMADIATVAKTITATATVTYAGIEAGSCVYEYCAGTDAPGKDWNIQPGNNPQGTAYAKGRCESSTDNKHQISVCEPGRIAMGVAIWATDKLDGPVKVLCCKPKFTISYTPVA